MKFDCMNMDFHICTDLSVGCHRGEVRANSSSCRFLSELDLCKVKSKQRHKKEVVDWLTTLFDGALLLPCDLIKKKRTTNQTADFLGERASLGFPFDPPRLESAL